MLQLAKHIKTQKYNVETKMLGRVCQTCPQQKNIGLKFALRACLPNMS